MERINVKQACTVVRRAILSVRDQLLFIGYLLGLDKAVVTVEDEIGDVGDSGETLVERIERNANNIAQLDQDLTDFKQEVEDVYLPEAHYIPIESVDALFD